MISRNLFVMLLAISAIWLTWLLASEVRAVGLSAGDIIVADSRAQGTLGLPAILKVDPQTGIQTIISSGDILVEPNDVAFNNGELFVADTRLFDLGAVIRIDPSNGVQSILSSGNFLSGPRSIAIDVDGSVLVAQGDGFAGLGGLIRIDPISGTQTVISSGGVFIEPSDVAVNSDGDYVVSDRGQINGTGSVFIVDRDTGVQTLLATGYNLINPRRLDIDAGGNILLMDSGLEGGGGISKIISIDSSSGAQFVISSGGLLGGEEVGLLLDGRLLSSGGSLVTVEPTTGDQTPLSAGGQLVTPHGFDIVPIPEPTTCGLALVATLLLAIGRYPTMSNA